jgi:Protein of unknown function (DUF3048) N-terminal domain/Protein of unknown function (DUF3048) C-terminal domain
MDDITWPPKKRSTLKIVPGSGQPAKPKLQMPHQVDTKPERQNLNTRPTSRPETNQPDPEQPTATAHQATENNNTDRKPPKNRRRGVHFKRLHRSKKKWAMIIAAILLLIGVGGLGAKALHNRYSRMPAQAPQPIVKKEPKPEPPKTEASRLSGLQVAPELNLRPVTGFMIENSPDARPQAGLKDAGIVYEAIAEGGITRFLALFQETRPGHIGPIRSVRPYYLDFLMPFNAGIAHAGGSPEALSDIKALGVKDLDQFANSGSYQRVSNRFAPHNLYTDFDKIDALNAKKGFTSSTFSSFGRKEEKAAATPTAKAINFNISSTLYNVRYDYDATNNLYLRSEGGTPHRDEKSGTQITPKVVIALVMNRGIASDGQHTKYGTTGSGHVFLFQDGIVTEGTWRKADRKAQFSFEDTAGKALLLNPGQTWISIVDANSDVTYTP